MKERFTVVLTEGNLGATQYMVRTMDVDQISEAIRDGFSVEPQGYEGRRILDGFKNALADEIESARFDLAELTADNSEAIDAAWNEYQWYLNKSLEATEDSDGLFHEAEKKYDEYARLLPDPSEEEEARQYAFTIEFDESILKWLENNKDFNVCLTVPESEKVTKEYKALDQMSQMFLDNLDTSERNALWQALQVERDKVLIRMRALETLREYLEYGEIL